MTNVADWIEVRLRVVLGFIAIAIVAVAQDVAQHRNHIDQQEERYFVIELAADTLPHLNISRSGHVTLCLDGELTVIGGHTDGFVLTPTAEYFRDGAWHVVPMIYPHDHGIALDLRSGKVFIAGGHKESLGIGQLFSAELYDPATHSFHGFGCMNQKRAFANAIEMADGQVVVAGNWYTDDGIEVFGNVYDEFMTNATEVKETTIARAKPYILRITDDDAILFGRLGNMGEPVDCSIIDRLKGPSYREPFLDTWHPLNTVNVPHARNYFIGNEATRLYQWLLPVENADGRVSIAKIDGPNGNGGNATFSLLDANLNIPDSVNGKAVSYSSMICDRERRTAYLIGNDDDKRIFVVAIPYDSTDAALLKIYMTEPQPILSQSISPVLTTEGDIIFAGGHLVNNFSPSNAVIRLPLGNQIVAAVEAPVGGNNMKWLWIIIPCLIAVVIAAIVKAKRQKRTIAQQSAPLIAVDDALTTDGGIDIDKRSFVKNLPKDEVLADLFRRIEVLMAEEELYLYTNLRASDVAARLTSNVAYISAAINSQRGCSFTQYLTLYRIAYAQRLMREDPDRKISTISHLSGFSTDSTFFRAFRSVTGMSPKEWLAASHDK